MTLNYHFVSSTTSDYSINKNKWDLDKLSRCFNFQDKWYFFDSEFTLGELLIGCIKCKSIVPSTLFKIRKEEQKTKVWALGSPYETLSKGHKKWVSMVAQ